MRLTLRKDTSFDLPPARNARKWQLAKEEAARQGRGGDIREIINIYTLMALLPTYKSHAAVQKAAGPAGTTTRSGKPIAAAAAPAYAQARLIWRQDGMAGASRLAEALERDYGHFSRQDHLDAADHHEQLQHSGSKAEQFSHRIAAWSHQMAADTSMEQAAQAAMKSLANCAGLLRTYIKAMPAARTACRPSLPLRKAGPPAYTSREMVNGSWRYHYAGDAHEGIGKTQSGKPIPHPGHAEYRNHMPGDTKFADYSQQDHADAHKLHAEAGKNLAAEADDIQHAYATRHGNTSVRENSQQADASAAHFRSATAARTMAQAHVDAAVTHARLGAGAAKSQTRRTLTMKSLSKADGHKYQSREMGAGGHWKYTYADGAKSPVTQSGKAIHDAEHHAHAGVETYASRKGDAEHEEPQVMQGMRQNAITSVRDAHAGEGYSAQDHRDAAAFHRAAATRNTVHAPMHETIAEAHEGAAGLRRSLTMKSLSKAAGDRGGVVIGKTRSGRPVYQSHDHGVATTPNGAVSPAQQAGNAQRVKATNPRFTPADHADAAAFHDQHAEQAKREAKTYIGASHNTQGPMYKQAMRTAAIHSALSAAHASHASSDEQDKGLAHASVSAKHIARYGLEGAQRRSGAGAAKSQTRRTLTMKSLSKADGHKYQSREMGAGGHWKYTYADGAGGKTSGGKGDFKPAPQEAIGMTRSGRGIFASHDHPMNASFTAADHKDAAGAHKKWADYANGQAAALTAMGTNGAAKQMQAKAKYAQSQQKAHMASAKQLGVKKSMTDPLGDITVESVYAPMGFARISDVDGTEIKTDAGSIDELAALVADMASYNAGTVVGGVLPAQRDKSTVPPAEEPPLVPQSTTIDASGNAPSDTPETEVVTKSCAALHSTLAAQWADAQSIVMGMPTFLPPDAPEGDARFALIGQ